MSRTPPRSTRTDTLCPYTTLFRSAEFDELNTLVGALLGTRDAEAKSAVGKARIARNPFDPDRIRLFEALFAALWETIPTPRMAPARTAAVNANMATFEAHFANSIEGTEFRDKDAAENQFSGVHHTETHSDHHEKL